MRTAQIALLGIFAVISTTSAAAQDVELQKLMSRRAAVADAYRQLAETVYGLQINSSTTVYDFVMESDLIHSAVDEFVRGVRIGEARYFPDNSCEVQAELTVADAVETLRGAYQQHYRGDRIDTRDFDSIPTRAEKKTLKTIGMGAPRDDLPFGLPSGVVALLPKLPGGDSASGGSSLPGVWKHVPSRARMMAVRGAKQDAWRQLAERIMGLRLTSTTLIEDFVTQSDEIRTEMDDFLKGAEPVGTYYRGDEMIVEVTMRIPAEQVIRIVEQLHGRHYEGDDIEAAEIGRIARDVVHRDFEATGMSVPPAKYLTPQAIADATIARPNWVESSIQATGEASDAAFDTAQGRLKARRAAELVAKRNLALQIAGLPIDDQMLVRDLVTKDEYVSTRVDAVLIHATIEETRFTDNAAIVTVSIPGVHVWSVVGDEYRRLNRE